MAKKCTDEQIIAALLANGTITAAAAACGISPRSIFGRMDNREFRALYMEAKNDILREATHAINGKLSEAINAVGEIMNDPNTNPAVRLQAAQTILANAEKFADRLSVDEKRSRETMYPPDPWDFGT